MSTKALKALTKKNEHLHEHLGDQHSIRALFLISRALFVQSCPYPRLGTTEGTTEKSILKSTDERSISLVARNRSRGYCSPVVANSATDLGGSNDFRRNSAPITIAGAFFVPAILCYGGLRRSTFGCAGFLNLRSANPVQLATLTCLAAGRGGSNDSGASPMYALTPSKIRAIAHRRMALAALRANSSLSVRLKRYNHHMSQVRVLEAQGGAL
ncbi:hypothetical protein [Pseudomonas caricapapayae]|uniref:hypothetical protein n=1 Tax=Pseudomonas caricapapayae TaxID=46678 RepID=UPI0006D6212D|nr:hypothetical protein [Pseudomonas caricapapayae]KAA8693062.1 hypothetical protein F4W67_21930 [Pseudomonas caricapapayae]RMV97040.1 hypothetical protein ALP01_200440 [Pseudomonas caricapapayae]